MEIAILRHGKSSHLHQHRTTGITDLAFKAWIRHYNTAPLAAASYPNVETLAYASQCKLIVSSTLQGSIDSARRLNTHKVIISDRVFIEAGLPLADWNTLKLYLDLWAIFFRIAWFFGYLNHSESFKAAKARANLAAGKLIMLAEQHQRVLLVGHGMFNHLLVKELRNRGWSGAKNPGTKHWSMNIYTK